MHGDCRGEWGSIEIRNTGRKNPGNGKLNAKKKKGAAGMEKIRCSRERSINLGQRKEERGKICEQDPVFSTSLGPAKNRISGRYAEKKGSCDLCAAYSARRAYGRSRRAK